jgi:ribonuclease HII
MEENSYTLFGSLSLTGFVLMIFKKWSIIEKKVGLFMKKQSIAQLKQLFELGKVTDEVIEKLRVDERKGVQQLITSYEKQQLKIQALKKRHLEMSVFEKSYYNKGFKYIAGVDEAGRGPLAGPVVAAAVILPIDFVLLGLDDSKQLTEAKRNQYYHYIKDQAISYGISIISSKIIDQINIYEATKSAMYHAINQLDPEPDHVLIDAVRLDQLTCSSEAITKGDASSISIAAASVLAKVTRDQYMKQLHKQYPMYEFASNMGYGTKQHLQKLKQHGVCPHHRRSFAPIKQISI